jgi:hypothetical protein
VGARPLTMASLPPSAACAAASDSRRPAGT